MVKTNPARPGRDEGRRTNCIRCGTCCMKGGPTLHEADAELFVRGTLADRQVYTLRRGEVVRNIDEILMVLDHEMIKIKGVGETWSCMFYDSEQSACGIYEDRPQECRAMKCWDPRELKGVMSMPCLQRKDLIKPGEGILKIVEAHDTKCSYAVLESAVRKLQGPDAGDAVNKILDLLQYDQYMRPFLADKLGIDPEAMDFLFGRPLVTTIPMFGLRVKQEGDTFTLLPLSEDESPSNHRPPTKPPAV